MNKINGLLILVVLSVLAACAPSGKTLKTIDGEILNLAQNSPFNIINGHEVKPTDEFAATIVGIYNLENNSLCTGSLIAESYVLTAAHCVAKEPKNLRVFFGNSLDTITAVNKVIGAVIPTTWGQKFLEPSDWGDIAVLKISGQLPQGYRPTSLLTEDNLQTGQVTILAGYGLADAIKKEGSGLLRKTSVSIADPKHGKTEVSLDQRNGSGACHGDSGGPAYVLTTAGHALWGVTSRGLNDPNDDCGQFAVYTNAIAYKEWINQARIELQAIVQ
ncbi:MAG: hypothetical protein RJB66_95 [Pseudomonadota bacterium]|jgi:secreted trypsin-like serine protease